ncbi:hypothetical protein ACP70R_038145 [Stipagrostis hirtigluma subsp. patula]
MAALPLRVSCSAPMAVAAPSRAARSIHGAIHVHPLRRRDPSSAAQVKMQARTRGAFLSHCQKRADSLPQPEREDDDPDTAEISESVRPCNLAEELLNYQKELRAALGVHMPPDMFLKEKERIYNYMRELLSSGGKQRVVAEIVCTRAREALDIASEVMDIIADIASSSLGTTKISQYTADQMVRTYATTFCNVAEDAHQMKLEMEAILSFLGALRGLGATCHILVQDVVAKLKDGHLKNSITHRMDSRTQEFDKKMNDLEDQIEEIKAQKVQKMATRILFDGLGYASLYVFWLGECRKSALHHPK